MEEFAIGANLEGAAARWNERERLDALAEFKNFGRQTDGLRRVVSNDAVFDRHLSFHFELLSNLDPIDAKKGGQELEALDNGAISLVAAAIKAPLQIVTLPLKSEVEAATKHAEIIFRPVDYAEAQVVSPTEVPCDSEFETGSELAEQFGFATQVMRLGMDSERVWRPLGDEDIPFAAAKNRTDTGPGVGRKTCARNWIAQCKCS